MQLEATKVNGVPIFKLHTEENIKKTMEKVMGATYSKRDSTWTLPAYYPFGEMVYDDLTMLLGGGIDLAPSVQTQMAHIHRTKKFLEKKELDPRFKFKTTPFDHQYYGIILGIAYMRLGLFWDMGVGKTKTIIDLIRYLRRNTLYMCPARLVENVVDEIKIHSFEGEINPIPILGKNKKEKVKQAELLLESQEDNNVVCILGYESATNYYEYLKDYKYTLLVCDESHKMRSHKSNVSDTVSKLARNAARRILLTGTPSLGNPLHLFVQLRILMPWLYPNYYAYRYRYIETSKYNKHIIVGYKNLQILRRQVDLFSNQLTKEECLDLPDRHVVTESISMSPEQHELYSAVAEGEHEAVSYNPIKLLISEKLHQVCGGTLVQSPIDMTICNECSNLMYCVEKNIKPFSRECVRKDVERPVETIILKDNPKLERLLEKLDTIVNGEGKKAIVWYRYNNEKVIIKERLDKKKITYLDYGEEGHDAVRQFNADDTYSVFLSQVQSCEGITLNAASYTIYYSLTFDLLHWLQSRDRNYRAGQDKKVIEYHLVISGSVDEAVSAALQAKINVNEAMLTQDLTSDNVISKIPLRRS